MKTRIILFCLLLAAGSLYAQSADTMQVVFYGKDATTTITERYFVMDAYGDTLTNDTSDEWLREVVGYIITHNQQSDSVNLLYCPLDKTFKVIQIQSFTGYAPRYDVDTTLTEYGDKEFYYQTKGYVK
jgi:hypothetical protein